MTAITVAKGDGIGPEIMEATLLVLKESGADLQIEEVEIGEKIYLAGHKSGIEDSTWESLRRTKVFLKAPITTPQGGGFRSLNVTVRTALGLYANVRPAVAYAPYVATKHPGMNVVIVRENEEDLYTGIEYHQTPNTYTAIKTISTPASERIIRYAFEYARKNNRKKVTCFTKDNIMKVSDGHFHKVFDAVSKDYPELENEHWIIDIGAAKLADTPETFDVVVLPNLYGDILSDVTAQIAGSVGLVGSANIGVGGAMFEAIHGSAPRRAGQNLANPSGLMLASVLMLNHIGQHEAAENFHNAWLRTLEDGIHTYDIYKENVSTEKVGTREFAQAVVSRLGQKPQKLPPVTYTAAKEIEERPMRTVCACTGAKTLTGVDVYVQHEGPAQTLIPHLPSTNFQLETIHNRGTKVWPHGHAETLLIDQWRCRYLPKDNASITHQDILTLLQKFTEADLDFVKTEHLYTFEETE